MNEILYQNTSYKITVTELTDKDVDPSMKRVYLIVNKADGVVLSPARSLAMAIGAADEAEAMLDAALSGGLKVPQGLSN